MHGAIHFEPHTHDGLEVVSMAIMAAQFRRVHVGHSDNHSTESIEYQRKYTVTLNVPFDNTPQTLQTRQSASFLTDTCDAFIKAMTTVGLKQHKDGKKKLLWLKHVCS